MARGSADAEDVTDDSAVADAEAALPGRVPPWLKPRAAIGFGVWFAVMVASSTLLLVHLNAARVREAGVVLETAQRAFLREQRKLGAVPVASEYLRLWRVRRERDDARDAYNATVRRYNTFVRARGMAWAARVLRKPVRYDYQREIDE